MHLKLTANPGSALTRLYGTIVQQTFDFVEVDSVFPMLSAHLFPNNRIL